ncbi:MAG: helix-turn-helix domain-containing protein [Clostridium sp.]|nr:helix-turn-helix domain-containing protein [Clostridium sp.]
MNTRNIIQQILDYIEDNLKAEILVDELCNMAGYSHVHYCRLFQSFVGMSVNEYINRRKLLYAVYDMSKGLTKIDTALNYGFETYAGFYKAFKREFNCSPSEFIKSYKGNKPYRINILQEEHIMISKNKVQKLLAEWGLQLEKITNIYNENTGKQSDNAYFIGSDYVIKFTNNLGNIKKNISISKAMMNADIPTFELVKTINGEDYIQNGELYFIITKRIKGEQLKCEDIFDNIDLAFCIGENIAKLHKALQTFDDSNYNYADVLREVKANLPKVKDLIDIDDFTDRFKVLYDSLTKQLIHRDINPSNMVFDNTEFKGFVDFDLSEVNIRIFDICYCATAILSECFSNQNIDKLLWFEILNKLICGYERISPLENEEKQAIPYVIYSIQTICIAYFRKFDKYEHLTKTNVDILKWIMDNEILKRNK